MNRYIRMSLLFATVVTGACAAALSTPAQMTGAYGNVQATSKEVKQAAAFAVKTRAKKVHRTVSLLKVENAESQVVAGINYRLCIRVRDGKAKSTTATAIVYKDLKKHMSLSSWRTGRCEPPLIGFRDPVTRDL